MTAWGAGNLSFILTNLTPAMVSTLLLGAGPVIGPGLAAGCRAFLFDFLLAAVRLKENCKSKQLSKLQPSSATLPACSVLIIS